MYLVVNLQLNQQIKTINLLINNFKMYMQLSAAIKVIYFYDTNESS